MAQGEEDKKPESEQINTASTEFGLSLGNSPYERKNDPWANNGEEDGPGFFSEENLTTVISDGMMTKRDQRLQELRANVDDGYFDRVKMFTTPAKTSASNGIEFGPNYYNVLRTDEMAERRERNGKTGEDVFKTALKNHMRYMRPEESIRRSVMSNEDKKRRERFKHLTDDQKESIAYVGAYIDLIKEGNSKEYTRVWHAKKAMMRSTNLEFLTREVMKSIARDPNIGDFMKTWNTPPHPSDNLTEHRINIGYRLYDHALKRNNPLLTNKDSNSLVYKTTRVTEVGARVATIFTLGGAPWLAKKAQEALTRRELGNKPVLDSLPDNTTPASQSQHLSSDNFDPESEDFKGKLKSTMETDYFREAYDRGIHLPDTPPIEMAGDRTIQRFDGVVGDNGEGKSHGWIVTRSIWNPPQKDKSSSSKGKEPANTDNGVVVIRVPTTQLQNLSNQTVVHGEFVKGGNSRIEIDTHQEELKADRQKQLEEAERKSSKKVSSSKGKAIDDANQPLNPVSATGKKKKSFWRK